MESIKKEIKKYVKMGLKKIMPGNFPNFIIIGAQKSGTSSLHSYLKQHPNLTGSSPKEIHYFDRLIYHDYSLKWYKSHFFRKSIRPQLYFETTPNYIYHESVASQISEINQNIKLVLILREPVSRAYSAWNMYRDFFVKNETYRIQKEGYPGKENPIYKYYYQDRASFPTFLEAVKIEQELIENNAEKEPAIIRRGFYANQIKNYLKYFSIDQILVLGFRNLINQPGECLKRVTDFVGVDALSIGDLDFKPKNKRSYKRKMRDQEYKYVSKIYEEPNNRLFNLLGFKPEW